jgi:RNA polymerase sigma-70 factor (ECF subfamily)
MQERGDEELMLAYANGNMAAFEQLYRRHRAPLYRFVLRLVRDPVTANDLFQGCWEKIIRARKSYRPAAPFRAWLYRIARNHVTDHFRRERPTSDLPPDSLPSANPGPEQQLVKSMQRQLLSEAVAGLPVEQREALLLRLEAGLTLAEIAAVTEVNPETAKSRLRYAVARLKATLDDGDGVPSDER